MAKYRVGDELIVIESLNDEMEKLAKATELKVTEENYATISLGIRIVDIQYEGSSALLTYRNHEGRENKVFASCVDPDNFDENRTLEKALLKAFQNEIISLSVVKNIKLPK